MPNRVTKGKALVGSLRSRGGGKGVFVLTNTVARTDTTAKTLFTLPMDAQVISLKVFGAAVSNAGTTATLSIGKSGGTGAEYLSAMDVKGATGAGQQSPTAALLLGAVTAADTVVTGTYAEIGASTSGGPWTVIMEIAL